MAKMKEGWRGNGITCTREAEGRLNDIKGREDLEDRNHYYVHYNGDEGKGVRNKETVNEGPMK